MLDDLTVKISSRFFFLIFYKSELIKLIINLKKTVYLYVCVDHLGYNGQVVHGHRMISCTYKLCYFKNVINNLILYSC